MEEAVTFKHVETEADIEQSFVVMRELRPHLENAGQYIERVVRQRSQGYRLLAACLQGKIIGLAGYRHQENLIHGRFTYVDDLVVLSSSQRTNIGGRLLDEVKREAKAANRDAIVLDTGLANSLAQRFYFRQGFLSRGLHFSQPL